MIEIRDIEVGNVLILIDFPPNCTKVFIIQGIYVLGHTTYMILRHRRSKSHHSNA